MDGTSQRMMAGAGGVGQGTEAEATHDAVFGAVRVPGPGCDGAEGEGHRGWPPGRSQAIEVEQETVGGSGGSGVGERRALGRDCDGSVLNLAA